jgi:hypothetical protein
MYLIQLCRNVWCHGEDPSGMFGRSRISDRYDVDYEHRMESIEKPWGQNLLQTYAKIQMAPQVFEW